LTGCYWALIYNPLTLSKAATRRGIESNGLSELVGTPEPGGGDILGDRVGLKGGYLVPNYLEQAYIIWIILQRATASIIFYVLMDARGNLSKRDLFETGGLVHLLSTGPFPLVGRLLNKARMVPQQTA